MTEEEMELLFILHLQDALTSTIPTPTEPTKTTTKPIPKPKIISTGSFSRYFNSRGQRAYTTTTTAAASTTNRNHELLQFIRGVDINKLSPKDRNVLLVLLNEGGAQTPPSVAPRFRSNVTPAFRTTTTDYYKSWQNSLRNAKTMEERQDIINSLVLVEQLRQLEGGDVDAGYVLESFENSPISPSPRTTSTPAMPRTTTLPVTQTSDYYVAKNMCDYSITNRFVECALKYTSDYTKWDLQNILRFLDYNYNRLAY